MQYLLTDKSSEDTEAASGSNKIKDTDKEFCQLFSLPNSECPVIGMNERNRFLIKISVLFLGTYLHFTVLLIWPKLYILSHI